MTDIQQCDAAAIIEAIEERQHVEPIQTENSDAILIAHHNSQTITDLTAKADAARLTPRRVASLTQAHSPGSFADYVRAYQAVHNTDWPGITIAAPAVFADQAGGKFTAVMDHHRVDALPGWGKWRLEYHLKPGERLQVWERAAAKSMTQGEMSGFLEDNLLDIHPAPLADTPAGRLALDFAAKMQATFADPITVLQFARTLQVHESNKVKSVYDRDTGMADLQFQSEHLDSSGARIRAPKLFALVLPIYEMGQPHFMPVVLQYKISEAAVKFGLRLPLLERQRAEAFTHTADDICEMLTANTEDRLAAPAAVPFFFGSPPRASE